MAFYFNFFDLGPVGGTTALHSIGLVAWAIPDTFLDERCRRGGGGKCDELFFLLSYGRIWAGGPEGNIRARDLYYSRVGSSGYQRPKDLHDRGDEERWQDLVLWCGV